MSASSAMRVLIHPPLEAEGSSPHLIQLVEALKRGGVEVVPATPAAMLKNPNAPLHVHWPEYFFWARGRFAHAAKIVVALLALLGPRSRSRRLVWTVHNLVPHGGWRTRLDERMFRLFLRRCTDIVVLSEGDETDVRKAYPDLESAAFCTIPLGWAHDRHAHQVERRPSGGPARILHVGKILPYKGQIETVMGLRPYIEAGTAQLTIVGFPADASYFEDLVAEIGELDVDLIPDFVHESELLELAQRSDLAVGFQTEGLNSGVPTALIPLGLRVVLRPGNQFDFFERHVGMGWVRPISDASDPDQWDEIIEWASTPRTDPPTQVFDWEPIAKQHRELYSR